MKPSTIQKRVRVLSTLGALGALYLTVSCLIHYVALPEPALPTDLAPKVGTIIHNARAGEKILVTQDRFETHGKFVQIEVTLEFTFLSGMTSKTFLLQERANLESEKLVPFGMIIIGFYSLERAEQGKKRKKPREIFHDS